MSVSLKQMRSYVRVATRFGMRGYPAASIPGTQRLMALWGSGGADALSAAEPALLGEIAEALAYGRTVNGSADDRIRVMMAPTVISTQTPATFKAIREAARELGNGSQVHVANSWRARDVEALRRLWRMGEIEVLENTGMLEDTLFAAHLLGIESAADLKLLASKPRFTYAHCPSGAGAGVIPSSQPWPEALAAGINTSIGLDTHSNDFVENIKMATVQGRARAQLLGAQSVVPMKEPTIWDALTSATLGGARGLGRDDLGRIRAGAKADLCSIAISGLLVGNGTRSLEPVHNLLYANGLAVRNVMTDGQWQLRDGRLLIADEGDLLAKGGAAAAKVWDMLRKRGYFDPPAAR